MENEEKYLALSRQLSCPDGEDGIRTADQMAISNKGMIARTIAALQESIDAVILEIGPGNGLHVPSVLQQFPAAIYYGIDISPLMVEQASNLNAGLLRTGKAFFKLTGKGKPDFADNFCSHIFTVNTIYFWKEPEQYLSGLLQLLRPKGQLIITFAGRKFMEQLPFTRFNFRLYDPAAVEELVLSSGFKMDDLAAYTETIRSNAGMEVEREFFVLRASKP